MLRHRVQAEIGKALGALLDISFVSEQDKEVCIVRVKPSPREVWIKDGGQQELFVRTGNQTVKLSNRETTEYIKHRWA